MLRAKQVGQVLRALVDFATKHDVFEVPGSDIVALYWVGPPSVKNDPPSFGCFWLIPDDIFRECLMRGNTDSDSEGDLASSEGPSIRERHKSACGFEFTDLPDVAISAG